MRYEVRMEDDDALIVQAESCVFPLEGDTIQHDEVLYLVEARRFDFVNGNDQPEIPMGVVLVSEVP